MPLKVIIVGAGIAGLCAAIALRQAGHEVEIFEKSKFATETGAALIISPNGARVLSSLNFSFHKARAVEVTSWRVLRGDNQAQLISVDLSSARDKFGAGIWAVHRVDLHNELLRLALDADLPGCPIRLHLSSEVIKASPAGQIYLKDGTVHIADLLIGADGLHSMMKSAVNVKSRGPISTGLSAFRFLIETNKLKASESIATILNNKNHSATLLADVTDTTKERHIIWYPCRDGQTLNFVGIHPSKDIDGDDPEAARRTMIEEFIHFAPEILEMIRHSSDVKCWPLSVHEPLESWYNESIVLIGDAAHPMLPFGGQGSNIAIEDGGTLGHLFRNTDNVAAIPHLLKLFQEARKARATRVQILSTVRAGREAEVHEALVPWVQDVEKDVPGNLAERTAHDYGYDVYRECDLMLEALAQKGGFEEHA